MGNNEIHYRYAISYLVSAIILIVSLAYYNVPDLVDKFSFALTLSSLLLALLAIFYTIISAHKQDSQFSKIIEATSKLSGSVQEIDRAAVSISLLTKEIPKQFKTISTKIDEIQNSYKAPTETERSAEITHDQSGNPESRKLKLMIGRLQFAGMAVLYLFVKASYKGKSIEYSDLDNFNSATLEYAIGVLNGFEVTALIDFKLHKGCIVPTHCDRLLYDHLRKELDTVISVVNEKSSKELSASIEWVDQKYA